MKKKKILTVSVIILAMVFIIVGATIMFINIKNNAISNNKNIGNVEVSMFETTTSTIDYKKSATTLKNPTILMKSGDAYARIIIELSKNETKKMLTEEEITKIKNYIYYDISYDIDKEIETPNLISDSTYTNGELLNLVNNNKIYNLYNKDLFELDAERSKDNKLVFNYKGILKSNEKATLFSNIVVPVDDILENENIEFKIHAEAIDANMVSNQQEAYESLDGE